MDEVVAYGRKVSKAQAGNCLEQCAAVALYLTGQSDAGLFNLVMLEPPADHVFVVMGQAENADHSYPDDMRTWSADAVVIDLWVGICVKARNYPEIWRMKLDVMGAVGQELSNATGWKRADDPMWTMAPTAHRKLAFCH